MRCTVQRAVMYEAIDLLRLRLNPVRDGNYLLGLSGGADSVALLMMLMPDVRNNRIRLKAVHVNHGLRSDESDGDESFCAALCQREGIQMICFRADLDGRKDEASARNARYAYFRQCCEENDADGLLLGHHADDQAETFLMRLLRGAGPEGLTCMKAEETVGGVRILRPMLNIRRSEIREALRTDGIQWREDSSNQDTAYFRNRIRQELLPVLESMSGSPVGKICSAAALISRDNDALDLQAENILKRLSDGQMINAAALAEEPAALRSRVLRKWWKAYGPLLKEHTLNAVQTEALDRLLFLNRGKVNLPGDMHAVRNGKFMFLVGDGMSVPKPVAFTGPETVFGSIRLTVTPSEGSPGDGKRVQEVPEYMLQGCVIRTRLPGDRIHPYGSTGSKKLQDYLTDRRIPAPFRDRIPLLCRDNEVLLAGGVGAGNIPDWYLIKSASVRLTWHGDMPWME